MREGHASHRPWWDEVGWLHARGARGRSGRVAQLDTTVDVTDPALAAAYGEGRLECHEVDFSGQGIGPQRLPGGRHGTTGATLLVGRSPEGGARAAQPSRPAPTTGRPTTGPPPVGVAPEARLRAVAVIEEGDVVARLAVALDALITRPPHVAVLPLGIALATPVLDTLISALAARDVLVVAPSGNHGAGRVTVPGSHPDCLSVGAVEEGGRVAAYSGSLVDSDGGGDSGGQPVPLVCGPGRDDRPPMPGAAAPLVGTSVAAVLVAGVATLLRASHPRSTAAQVWSALMETAAPVPDDQKSRAAHGMIQPVAAHVRLGRGPGVERTSGLARRSRPTVSAGSPESGPWVDPRLGVWREDDHRPTVPVVLEFTDRASAVRVAGEASPPGSTGWLRVLDHAPICVGRVPRGTVDLILARPGLLCANAGDVDRRC